MEIKKRYKIINSLALGLGGAFASFLLKNGSINWGEVAWRIFGKDGSPKSALIASIATGIQIIIFCLIAYKGSKFAVRKFERYNSQRKKRASIWLLALAYFILYFSLCILSSSFSSVRLNDYENRELTSSMDKPSAEDIAEGHKVADEIIAQHYPKDVIVRSEADSQRAWELIKNDSLPSFDSVKPSAEQGEPTAQALLGLFYFNGTGVQQDFVQSYMWFNLSAAQGDKDALIGRNKVIVLMTPVQIEEGQRLTREWLTKHQEQ